MPVTLSPKWKSGTIANSITNTNSGNVGIGKDPGLKFDVSGAIRTDNQLISTVATGTAPLAVTSTTTVANLSADSVDGYHSASIFKDNDVVMNTNPFAGRKLFINSLNNAYFRADKRWVVTASQYKKSDNSLVSAYTATAISYLFNGSYEESFIILAGNYAIININFSPEIGGTYPNYPYGNFYLSHYSTSFPLAAVTNLDTLRVYCNYAPHGIGWHTMSFADFIRTNVLITKAGNQFYLISQAEFKLNANDTAARNLSEIDVQLDRPGPNEMPIIDKFKQNILYDGLSFENGTYASMIYLNPSGYSWINGGNVGIGTTNPTAVLHLKAGTATASTAPLKFTTGTDLTTAEAGAMEYDGTNLHFTPVGTTRKTIAYTVDTPQITQNISLTAQVAAIGSTNITGTATAGLYRVSYNLLDTTADLAAGTIMVNFEGTDEAGAFTMSSVALPLTALGRTQGTFFLRISDTSSISYSTTLVGLIGTSQYALFVSCEKLL